MARLNVNPTRMELKKLKARLSTAVRGHKLLKDKSDEMIRRFSEIVREAKRLREDVESEIALTLKRFSVARSFTPAYEAETAFAMPATAISAECDVESIMGVAVPKISLPGAEDNESEGVAAGAAEVPYAFPEITGEADEAVKSAYTLLPKMLKLAETEKAAKKKSATIWTRRNTANTWIS